MSSWTASWSGCVDQLQISSSGVGIGIGVGVDAGAARRSACGCRFGHVDRRSGVAQGREPRCSCGTVVLEARVPRLPRRMESRGSAVSVRSLLALRLARWLAVRPALAAIDQAGPVPVRPPPAAPVLAGCPAPAGTGLDAASIRPQPVQPGVGLQQQQAAAAATAPSAAWGKIAPAGRRWSCEHLLPVALAVEPFDRRHSDPAGAGAHGAGPRTRLAPAPVWCGPSAAASQRPRYAADRGGGPGCSRASRAASSAGLARRLPSRGC
jgi:hypothetical protein